MENITYIITTLQPKKYILFKYIILYISYIMLLNIWFLKIVIEKWNNK